MREHDTFRRWLGEHMGCQLSVRSPTREIPCVPNTYSWVLFQPGATCSLPAAASSAVSLGETPAAGPALLVLWDHLNTSVRASVKSLFWKMSSNIMNCKVSGSNRVEKHLSQSLQCQKLSASQWGGRFTGCSQVNCWQGEELCPG